MRQKLAPYKSWFVVTFLVLYLVLDPLVRALKGPSWIVGAILVGTYFFLFPPQK